MPCFCVSRSNRRPYQLIFRILVQPLPGQIMTVGDFIRIRVSSALKRETAGACAVKKITRLLKFKKVLRTVVLGAHDS